MATETVQTAVAFVVEDWEVKAQPQSKLLVFSRKHK